MSIDAATEVFLRILGEADEIDTLNADLTDEEERDRARVGSALSHNRCRWFADGFAHGMAEMRRRRDARRGKLRA